MKSRIAILLSCVAATISLAGCGSAVGTHSTVIPKPLPPVNVTPLSNKAYLYRSDTDNTVIAKGVMDLNGQMWNYTHKKETYQQVVSSGEKDLSQAQAALADSKTLTVPDKAEYRQYQVKNLTFASESVGVIQDWVDGLKHGDASIIKAGDSELNKSAILQRSLLEQHQELLTEAGK